MKFITVLMVLVGVARAPPPTAGPSKSNKADGHLYSLQEVMRIFPDTDEQNNDPAKSQLNANCYRWFEGDEDNPPKVLNKMWKQVYEMASAARYALSEEGYKDEENRRLATRYFGIVPNVITSKKGMFGTKVTKTEVLPTKGVQLEKLLQAKGWFKDLQTFMDKPKPEAEQAWIFCDSDFTQWKQKWSPRKDPRGRVVKNSDGSHQTLQQWLSKTFSTPFDDNHHWFYLEEPYSTYFPVDGENNYRDPRRPSQVLPFKPDRKGQPHFCTPGTVDAHMFGADFDKNHPQYLPGPVLVMCMHMFTKRSLLDELNPNGYHEGTRLESLDTRSRTLFHELIHLVADGWSTAKIPHSSDASVARSTCQRDSSNNKCVTEPPTGWHLQKSNFQKLDGQQAAGGVESMYITLHDLAEPQGRRFNIYDYPGNFFPENYAWFATSALLHKNNPDEFWSTGVCKNKAETLEESLAPPAGVWHRVP